MAVPLLILTGGTLLAFGAVAVFADESAKNAAKLAVAVTLPAAAVTLMAVLRVWRLKPEVGPAVVMAGTFIRMAVAVGAVVLLSDRATEFGTTADDLRLWATVFYLLTLMIETGLLYIFVLRLEPGTNAVVGEPNGQTIRAEVQADEPPASQFRG